MVHRFTREELYEPVRSRPISTLAVELGGIRCRHSKSNVEAPTSQNRDLDTGRKCGTERR